MVLALKCFRMMNIGHMLNGLGGPVAMAGAPVISSVWFPTRERTTATAVGTIMASFGTGASFLIGRLLYVCIEGKGAACVRVKEKFVYIYFWIYWWLLGRLEIKNYKTLSRTKLCRAFSAVS